ncbi:hypothetical protein F2Q68_00025952, partial [Brassica cretica]
MATVWRRLLKTETIPRISQSTRKLFSTDASSSFADRLRNLPKDFPSTQAKRDASLLIGRTPLVFLNRVTEGCEAYIAAKQEHFQPTCSVKDRPALAMVEDAEKKNLITPGKTTLIEPTSGNMGISMAFIAALKGYRIIMTMPSYTSLERRVTMRSFGAELVLTDPAKGMGGTVKKAYDLLESTPDAHMLQQFANPANTQIHFDTTGPEIWEDTLGNVDIFVMGIGSGGTVSGVGQYLKSKNPNVKIYGVEPAESNILNGGKPGPHAITGNGVGFKPDILDMDVMESVLEVSSEDAIKMARELALKEGLMVNHAYEFPIVRLFFTVFSRMAPRFDDFVSSSFLSLFFHLVAPFIAARCSGGSFSPYLLLQASILSPSGCFFSSLTFLGV